jgi:thioester reductase-like protein
VISKKTKLKPRSFRQYTLLTGATGLLGRYLMRDLLRQDQRVAVLVRPNQKMQARERVEQILQWCESDLGHRLPRPVILAGDVKRVDLGLSENQLQWVKANCSQVIHSAAILDFRGTDRTQEPWVTNLGGTQNVLDFSRKTEIENFHYVSTAYVCGNRPGPILENDLLEPQTFRNDYERSKFEAENLVRSASGFDSKTIYRPAVIVGDSNTGYTSTYHGLFLYLRLMAMLVPQMDRNEDGVIETPLRLPFNGDEPRNLVPIDWVSKVISHLVQTPEAHGETYHLTPEKCTNAKEVIEYCYEYFNSAGVEFVGQGHEVEADSEFAQTFFDSIDIYSSYETSDPEFDKSNVDKFAGHLPCPAIDKEMVFRFLEFGKKNKWGKRRLPKVKASPWVESYLPDNSIEVQDSTALAER